jgi:transposase InsO family protein
MARERTQSVCDGFSSALQTYGVPAQALTDNGKVFTGRFAQPPVEVLFDRIRRENGVDHILTQPRSPTTTEKIERFHKTLRVEFDTGQVFRNLKTAQEALDESVNLREWRRWCSKRVEAILIGERIESLSNWLASTLSRRPQNRRSIAAW